MQRVLKIAGLVLGASVLLILAGVAGVYAYTGAALGKSVESPAHDFAASSGAEAEARGEHVLRALVKCNDCHGDDLGGKMLIDDPAIGRIWVPNLTAGAGGVAGYTDADWERAVRHGVARDGRRLIVMPSEEYQYLSDEDLGAVVAYLRSVPAVDRERVPTRVGPLARALYLAGQFPLFGFDVVTHGGQAVPSVPIDTTAEYGQYLGSVGCSGCHGAGYSGGKIPGTPPDWPAAANITPGGIGHYSFEQFDAVLRTGTRPDGSQLHALMPIGATRLMTDVEMKAMWNYLRSVPSKPFGMR